MYRKKIHLHCMGIGGIGMSGIAKILRLQGYQVSGCDADVSQASVQELSAVGCTITQGHYQGICLDSSIDMLVFSSAIKQDHPELVAARARGIPVVPRALMLAELMRTKFGIAIAGAHGKTTTTSMVSHILIQAGLNPTVIIGGRVRNLSTNAQMGNGDFLVAEADESDRSLLYLHATLAIITNIDREHMDTYANLDDIKMTFKQFLNNLPFYGKAILCTDDPVVRSLLPLAHVPTITYSLADDADIYATDMQLNANDSTFVVHYKGQALGRLQIFMPGRHNILNALAATALALELEVPFTAIAHALATFSGVERRFSYHGIYRAAELFDDYGHHPKEIFNTLLVARKRAQGKLHVIFQPQRYTRTYHLWEDFVTTFATSDIDSLTITDIYTASEQPIDGITGERLLHAIASYTPKFPCYYVPYQPDMHSLIQQIDTLIAPGDLVLLLGAGKMHTIAEKLVQEPRETRPVDKENAANAGQ
ncbi:UDP-N-acetylmuramate--L-alanine ligase [Candidatus Dependentiae bacterium]|nr:UDP-N-acetylmuramate--L-alanine ligase [Candidatus Dependentiae bacterium]